MSNVIYHIVPHDGGWAYQSQGVYSETFPDKFTALALAKRVASLQRAPGEAEEIHYADENGNWKTEHAEGNDRPNVLIVE